MVIRGFSRGFAPLVYNSTCLPMRAMRNHYTIRGPLWSYLHRCQAFYFKGYLRGFKATSSITQTIFLYYNHITIITWTPMTTSLNINDTDLFTLLTSMATSSNNIPLCHWWQQLQLSFPLWHKWQKGLSEFVNLLPLGLCWLSLSIWFSFMTFFADHFLPYKI